MNDNEREMDLALAEAEQENRLLRARNERLEREILAAADAEAARIYAEGMVTVGHMRQKIAAEREACAKVCESRITPGAGSVAILNGAADAIRARDQG
jgi:hypothetical protein